MKKDYWLGRWGGVLLLGISFVVGLVLVKPSEKSPVESLPVVGKWIVDRQAVQKPMVDE